MECFALLNAQAIVLTLLHHPKHVATTMGATTCSAAAAQAKLQRIVYLGGLVPGDDAGEHIDSRRQTGDILRRGSVPVTEIRAGIIVGPGSAAFEVMRDLTLNLPVMVTWHCKSSASICA